MNLDKFLIDMAVIGNTEKVRELLDQGADVHASDDWSLRCASVHGHTETVKLLLDHGADVHAMNDEALRWASEHGHTETVKVLLDHGANVNALFGQALINASHNGHTETVKVLLDNGADVHENFDLSFHNALANGHTDIIKLLQDYGTNAEALKISLDSFLVSSAVEGDIKAVMCALDHGADIHSLDDDDRILSLARFRIDSVKLLLDHDANQEILK